MLPCPLLPRDSQTASRKAPTNSPYDSVRRSCPTKTTCQPIRERTFKKRYIGEIGVNADGTSTTSALGSYGRQQRQESQPIPCRDSYFLHVATATAPRDVAQPSKSSFNTRKLCKCYGWSCRFWCRV